MLHLPLVVEGGGQRLPGAAAEPKAVHVCGAETSFLLGTWASVSLGTEVNGGNTAPLTVFLSAGNCL